MNSQTTATLTDRQARDTASGWYSGGGSALYALLSTGAIDSAYWAHNIRAEIQECIAHTLSSPYCTSDDRDDLRALLAYVERAGARPAVEGWTGMPWE